MGISLVQNTDGSAGLAGSGGGDGGMVCLSMRYDANSVDQVFFVAHRRYIVTDVRIWPLVAGTDGSAVTVAVKHVASGSALNTGTKPHTSTMDLKGTINTAQVMVLATDPADRIVAAGEGIGLDFSGTLTAAVGSVSVTMCPA
jgi:hypothetical protein